MPRDVLVLQLGLVFNAFGNGAVAPFSIIYLHDVRGISLGTAGLVAATSAGTALVSALVGGSLADRLGPRTTLIGGLLVAAAAWSLYPLITEPWHAFVLASAAGAGGGTYLTSQSALVAVLTPAHHRPAAFAQQRVAANLGLGLGGLVAGLVVTTSRPASYTLLFLGNAVTFLVFVAFLSRVRALRREPTRLPGGYGIVLRDRAFIGFVVWNLVVVAAAISLLNSLVPVYAKNEAGASERTIGVLFLVNTLLIVLLQLPVSRLQRGRRRMHSLAAMGVGFGVSWLLVASGSWAGTVALVTAFLVFGVAECIYDAVQGPLIADLAPAPFIGRYMAVMGFSWQLGFIAGPGGGGFVLARNPGGFWLLVAAICGLSGAYALLLERSLPEQARRSP